MNGKGSRNRTSNYSNYRKTFDRVFNLKDEKHICHSCFKALFGITPPNQSTAVKGKCQSCKKERMVFKYYE
jgi:hypothetical protein